MTPQEKLAALNQLLSHAKSSLFYSERLPEKPLTTLAEFKGIPLTTKEDLKKCGPCDLLCVPKRDLFQYHETFGTTGSPISVWYTKGDFEHSSQSLTQWGVNFRNDDIILIRFPYAISTIAHLVHEAAHRKDACVIPASSRTVVSPFIRIINLMQKLEVTILASLPLQAILIAETAEMLGLKPAVDFPRLRAICTAGETLPYERRRLIEEIWQVPVFDNYGMTELGPTTLDCPYGTTHPIADDFILEILDETLTIEVEPGQIGYLVVTTLNRTATPMIRYFTGDRARFVQKNCPCGQELALEIHGRREDTLVIGTKQLDRWDLEKIISLLPCRRFWVAGPSDQGLQLIVEQEKPGDSLAKEVLSKIQEEWQITVNIEIVPKGTLYDRSQLLEVGVVGKPRYIYTAAEMATQAYLKSPRT